MIYSPLQTNMFSVILEYLITVITFAPLREVGMLDAVDSVFHVEHATSGLLYINNFKVTKLRQPGRQPF